MNVSEFILDEHFSIAGLAIPEQQDKFSLSLSDSLSAVEEVLSVQYKETIVSFVNASTLVFAKNMQHNLSI